VIDCFDELFVKNERRYEVHVSHKKFSEKGDSLLDERRKVSGNVEVIGDVTEFVQKQRKHEDYYKLPIE
jgi:hypothetical protein